MASLADLYYSVPNPDRMRTHWLVGEDVRHLLPSPIVFGHEARLVPGAAISLVVDYGTNDFPCPCGRTTTVVDARSRIVGTVIP